MWVGIQYDEPYGKNDGSVEEKCYFKCQPKYGGLVRVANVTVGKPFFRKFSNCNIGYSNNPPYFGRHWK